jgi:hypothetical protein
MLRRTPEWFAAASLLCAATCTSTADPANRCNPSVATEYQCGDKLLCVTRHRVTEIKTGRRLPNRLFHSGPRGGLYSPWGKCGAPTKP